MKYIIEKEFWDSNTLTDFFESDLSKKDYLFFCKLKENLFFTYESNYKLSQLCEYFEKYDKSNFNRTLKKLDKAGFISFENKTVVFLK
jgi:DNA-binding MarR family transcriptional regulator